MKNFLILLVVALVVAGGYGYSKNPKACQKLGSDVADDLKLIFTPGGSTPTAEQGTPGAASAAAAAVANPAPLPVIAPDSTAAPAAATAASASTAPPPVPTVAPDAASVADLGEVVSAPGLFSYHAPKGWSVEDAATSKFKIAKDVLRNDFAANINVVTESYPNSLAEYVDSNKQQLSSSTAIQNVKFVDQQPFTTTSGLQGVRLTVLDTVKGVALQQVFYFFTGTGDAKFIAVCTSLAGDGVRLAPTFDVSMKSFTLP